MRGTASKSKGFVTLLRHGQLQLAGNRARQSRVHVYTIQSRLAALSHMPAQLLSRLDDTQDADDTEEAQHAHDRRREGGAPAAHRADDDLDRRDHHQEEVEAVPRVLEVGHEAQSDPLDAHLEDVDRKEDVVDRVHGRLELRYLRLGRGELRLERRVLLAQKTLVLSHDVAARIAAGRGGDLGGWH